MSRLQDSIIDDDEESCPLCIEEFDLTDKNFKPCPCGYQICQFCFNSLKNTYEKSTCPNCRRIYDEKTIQFKIPSKEDIVHDKENKARKQAATKRKEGEKREVETSNRRNLAGVRVKQQNLVYVIGLVPSVKDESTLLQTLRGTQYFGQYGEIDKIVVSKSKPGSTSHGIGVYITYASREAAALCIEVVDGSMNGDRVLRAQYGTTKYCSAYLRGENCSNKSCTFLHETGEEGHGTTLQNEPSRPKPVTRSSYNNQAANPQTAPRNPQATTLPPLVTSQPMQRESSKENEKNRAQNTDTSALPSTASWANKDTSAQTTKTRRPSQAGGRPTPSPQSANFAHVATKAEESARQGSTVQSPAQQPANASNTSDPDPTGGKRPLRPPSTERTSPADPDAQNALLDKLVSNVNSPGFRFSFDDKAFSNDELAAIARCPTMIDPYGGAKRRLMREKEAERQKQQIEAQAKLQARSSPVEAVAEEENVESGSLALGGEPEEGARNFSTRSAIQRPTQPSSAGNPLNDQFLDASTNSRSLTPQQRQQLALLGSANIQQAPVLGQSPQQGFGLGNVDDQRHSSVQNQHYDPSQGHARQSSRYSFANDSVKPNPVPRFSAQQHQSASTPQHFYTSGVQGPPPGLKTAGTPPVSGGGMFAQGHGFTSNMSAGFGATKDSNAEMLMRGRSGTGPGHDTSKRSGVADLADPSILQARLHSNTGGAGQGLLGSQNSVDQDFPPLAAPTKPQEALPTPKSRVHSVQSSIGSPVRSTTPRVPPGLSLPHAHPTPLTDENETRTGEKKASTATSGPVAPALPALPLVRRASTAKAKHPGPSEDPEPAQGTQDNPSSSMQTNGLNVTTADGEVNGTAPTSAEKGNIQPAPPFGESFPSRGKREEPARFERPLTSNATQNAVSNPLSDEKLFPQLEKLDISAAVGKSATSRQSPPKNSLKITPQSTTSMTSQADSVPDTPIAGATKSPDRASAGRPRTLRLTAVTTAKPETATVPAATERSGKFSAGVLRQVSRQESSSPIPRSHPSTPTVSEHGTSAAISRAGSPPVSERGGIAPERKKGKGTTRKEKKAKFEAPVEPRSEGSAVPSLQVAEEVGPIISRQKKKKKKTQDKDGQPTPETKSAGGAKLKTAERVRSERDGKEDSDQSTSHETSTHPDHSMSEAGEAGDVSESGRIQTGPKSTARMEGRPAVDSAPRRSYTLNDLFNDANRLHDTEDAIAELLNSSISATFLLLREALDTDDVDLDSALFHAPPLNSYRLPHDSRRGAEYLEANGYSMTCPFGEIYLSSHDRKQLLQGRAVRHSDSSKPRNVLKRGLITPTGAIFRHLSAEEEDRVVELENRLRAHEEKYGITGKSSIKALDASDFMNLSGGLQELMSFPPLHRVGLLTAEPGTEDVEEDEDGEFGANASDETEDEMAPLASGFGATPEVPMKKPMSPTTMKRKADALTTVNLRNMDVYKLQKRIRETQVEMEGARKDAEALDKRASRKAKDVTRWREALLKEIAKTSGGT